MKYVLGIDQGSSKTCALVADTQGHIQGIGYGAGACHSSTGMQTAMAAIRRAADDALRQAGIRTEALVGAAGGLTGVDWPYEETLLSGFVSDTVGLPRENLIIVNDCIVALRAATDSPAGCILCAGSGLNCAVRNEKGESYTYGFYIEDAMQGGTALGRRTLQAVYDAESGVGGKTLLTEAVLKHMGFQTVDEMLHQQVTAGLDGKCVLNLPRVLEEYALRGDEIACDVLKKFGQDISKYVVCGLRRMDMLDARVNVVLSGSIFKCRAVLVDTVKEEILSSAPKALVEESEYEPAVGAALLALDRFKTADMAVINQNIRRDAERFHMLRMTAERSQDE